MAVKIDKGKATENLSLTPLIDVVFLLLIFFLVATRFSEEEKELDLLLPDASEAMPVTSKPRELYINIDEKGRYFITGKFVSAKDLPRVVRQAYVNNPGRASAVIRADRRATIQHMVTAIDACKIAKIRDYRVTTRKGEG